MLQGLLLVALLAVVFPGTFLRGEMISPGDMVFAIPPWSEHAPAEWDGTPRTLMSDVVTAFHPYYVLVRRALDAGEWPLWNDLELAGVPLLANMQSAPFYPPRLLHAFLDISVATTLYIILKLWLNGMTAYLCGRVLKLNAYAARFLSVAWMLSSFNLTWCNWSLPDVGVWLPVLFLSVESVLSERYRRGFFLMALGGAMSLFAGHPETAFTLCLGLGFYFAARLVWEGRWGHRLWKPIAVCSGAWAVALLVCSVQLLPFIEYLRHSSTYFDRSESQLRYVLNPGGLVSFWVPRFYGATRDGNPWGTLNSNVNGMLYPGMAVWMGVALLAACAGKRRRTDAESRLTRWYHRRDPRVVGLVAASVACVLLALDAPPFQNINRLPVFASLLCCYHIGFALFALPLLAAIGIDRWTRTPHRMRALGWPLLGLVPMAAIVAAGYLFSARLLGLLHMEDYVHRQLWIAAGAMLASLLIVAAHCVRPNAKRTVTLLTLALAADLLVANHGLNPTCPRSWIAPETELTSYLQSFEKPCRFGLGEGDIPAGFMVPYGLESWLGYDGLYPARIIRFMEALEKKAWGPVEPVRAINYFLSNPKYPRQIPPEAMERLELVATKDGLEVYRNPRAFSRAFLVGGVQVVDDERAMFRRMVDPDFDPAATALVESPPPSPITATAARVTGQTRILRHTTTHVAVEADADRDCVLVLADQYYPGWNAFVDGEPAAVFPVYHAFRGIALPAGKHLVEFKYAPVSFRLGLFLSVATLAASVIVGLRMLVAR
ncbi:MAG: YfhO family protein [Nitrospiraceae bacterium]|nr:YfhO family protein [Nitrospiraceae bacterium]